MSSVFFVVGPHRSGTSIVGRIIHLLGADLGPDDDLIPASETNPTGHWENRSLVQVNDELLRRLGGSWSEPPQLAEGWETAADLNAIRQHATQLVGRLFSAAPAAFKDPRSSLLLPFWRTVTEIDGCMLVLRGPHAVAASLAARNGLTAEAAARLWLLYAVSAWRDCRPRSIIRYEELLSDPCQAESSLRISSGFPSRAPPRSRRYERASERQGPPARRTVRRRAPPERRGWTWPARPTT